MRSRESHRAGRAGLLGFVAACAIAICQAPDARAQALYVGFDANVPARSSGEIDWEANQVHPGLLAVWVNWHRHSYLDQSLTRRLGFRYSRSVVTLRRPNSEYYRYPHVKSTWELTFDRLAARSEHWLVTVGAGLGWLFVSEDYSTGNPDAAEWFPDSCWILTPEVRLVHDSHFPISAFVSVRAPLQLSGDDETLFPFENGPIFSLGFLIR